MLALVAHVGKVIEQKVDRKVVDRLGRKLIDLVLFSLREQ